MIKVIQGNIWDHHAKGHYITITVNCNIKTNGHAVMGAGIALEVKQRFPDLPRKLGEVKERRAVVVFPEERIITFPTKINWYESSTVELISSSLAQLIIVSNTMIPDLKKPIYCVKFGCSNGRLSWEKDVRPAIEPFINEADFVFVDRTSWVKPDRHLESFADND